MIKRNHAALNANLRRWRQLDFFALCLEAKCLLSATRITGLRNKLSGETIYDADTVRAWILAEMESEAREQNERINRR